MKKNRYASRVRERILQTAMIALLAGWGLSAQAYSISWGTSGGGTTTVSDVDAINNPTGDKSYPCAPANNDICGVTNLNSNLGTAAALETQFGYAFTDSLSSLTLAYKQNVGESTDSGTFASSYSTSFDPATDPSGATVTYGSGDSISCPDCYLLVKDGNAEPNQYLFALTGWDGTSTITLSGFFADTITGPGNNGGSISHIEIWNNPDDGGGPPNRIPEPNSLGLVGLALAGFGWSTARARRRNS